MAEIIGEYPEDLPGLATLEPAQEFRTRAAQLTEYLLSDREGNPDTGRENVLLEMRTVGMWLGESAMAIRRAHGSDFQTAKQEITQLVYDTAADRMYSFALSLGNPPVGASAEPLLKAREYQEVDDIITVLAADADNDTDLMAKLEATFVNMVIEDSQQYMKYAATLQEQAYASDADMERMLVIAVPLKQLRRWAFGAGLIALGASYKYLIHRRQNHN